MDQAPTSVILEDIHSVIREFFFLHFECPYVPYLCNSSVHEIDALGMSWDMGMFLIFVQNLVASDLAEPATN